MFVKQEASRPLQIETNDSSASQCTKRKRLIATAESQRGALDRFIVKDTQINSENQAPHGNIDDSHENDVVELEAQVAYAHLVDECDGMLLAITDMILILMMKMMVLILAMKVMVLNFR